MLSNAAHFDFLGPHCETKREKKNISFICIIFACDFSLYKSAIPCRSTCRWWRTVDSSASDSMRHSNVAPISLRVNIIDKLAFSVNKPFASGPSLVDTDSLCGRRNAMEMERERKKKNRKSMIKLLAKALMIRECNDCLEHYPAVRQFRSNWWKIMKSFLFHSRHAFFMRAWKGRELKTRTRKNRLFATKKKREENWNDWNANNGCHSTRTNWDCQ